MFRRLNIILEPLKTVNIPNAKRFFDNGIWGPILRNFSTNIVENEPPTNKAVAETKPPLNKAMKAYLERAQEHEEFMKVQRHEYQIGKRHLANMMGENPETFTQEDVDCAIEYLFPSGLYDKKARPMMKPPEEVFPQKKEAEFDETGRPHHFLFYTGKPNFYQILYDTVEKIEELNKFEDGMIRKNLEPDPNLALELSGSNWLDAENLSKKLMEFVTNKDHENFVNVMDRLASLPYSYKEKDFIEKYRASLMNQTTTYESIKPQIDEDGRQFVTVYEVRRKRAIGNVTVRVPGTGKISINGQDINYFSHIQEREQILFPLIFTNMNGKIDVEAEIQAGGPSGQAGAIRYGISWALRSFVDQEMMENMRLAGLLSFDVRTRERKKPGQAGARRKFTWKKR